jgi:N-glycosylase/DNA lyase
MAAFVISEVEILDETVADQYRALAAASIEEHGGRYLVRGATPDAVEGEVSTRGAWWWSSFTTWTSPGGGTPRTPTPRRWPFGTKR